MQKFLMGALWMVLSATCIADIDVSCKGSGCLVDGWVLTDSSTGIAENADCNASAASVVTNCDANGWQTTKSDGKNSVTTCSKGGACFSRGTQVVSPVAEGI
jgi:hypothetical protein